MNSKKTNFSCLLNTRQIIELSGNDREAFLQGLITNDAPLLQKQPIVYSLMLSPQGKFQFDFFIINLGDSWLIDIDKNSADAFLKRLQLFKLRSNVQITLSSDWQVVVSSEKQDNELCYTDPRLEALGYRIYGKNLELPGIAEIYENYRLAQGVPDSADMVFDKSIPLEWGMDELNAISWTKGCYMGQELTARSRYVGQIRKRALPVTFLAPGEYPVGDKILANDKEVGELRASNNKLGIALLRLEALEATLSINGHPIEVQKPDWMIFS